MKRDELGLSRSVQQICTTKSVKMSCDSMQFHVLSFCGPHAKPHGLIGLSKQYHLRFDPK